MTKSLPARTREALPPGSLPPRQIIAAISKTLLSEHFPKGPAAGRQCRSPHNGPEDALTAEDAFTKGFGGPTKERGIKTSLCRRAKTMALTTPHRRPISEGQGTRGTNQLISDWLARSTWLLFPSHRFSCCWDTSPQLSLLAAFSNSFCNFPLRKDLENPQEHRITKQLRWKRPVRSSHPAINPTRSVVAPSGFAHPKARDRAACSTTHLLADRHRQILLFAARGVSALLRLYAFSRLCGSSSPSRQGFSLLWHCWFWGWLPLGQRKGFCWSCFAGERCCWCGFHWGWDGLGGFWRWLRLEKTRTV